MRNNNTPIFDFNWEELERDLFPQASHDTKVYDEEPIFHQGVAIVKRKGKYGAIMVDGKEILPPIYDALTEFTNGLAKVKYKGEERTVNLSGQIQVKKENEFIFIPDEYEWGCDFSGNACIVERSGKYGLLTLSLKTKASEASLNANGFCELLSPRFDTIIQINKESYLATNERKGIIINTYTSFIYEVKDCIISKDGYFEGAVVSQYESGYLWGIVNKNMEFVQPIENYSIEIKYNKFFVINQTGKGVGLCTLDGEIAPKGKYVRFRVLNEFYIAAIGYNYEDCLKKKYQISLLNAEGNCVITFSGFSSDIWAIFSSTNDGYVELNHNGCKFKISPNGELFHDIYIKNQSHVQYERMSHVSWDLVNYEYIEHFNGEHFIAGKVIENGIFRFGVIDSNGITILPFEYSRLKILSKDFIAYSNEDENILDLKTYFKDKTLQWILYNINYVRIGDKYNILHFGIINSEYKKICTPKYRNIMAYDTGSSIFFKVSIDGNKWGGVIDITDKIILPIKFDNIDFVDKKNLYDPIRKYDDIKEDHLLGVVSNASSWDSQRIQNGFDETGSFIVPLKDGKTISISSTAYDGCDVFNDAGWAKVFRNGLVGKINTKGKLISLFDDNLMVVPNCFDWAYDFDFGYAPVYKDGRWGIADINWTLVIPCIYESIEPLCELFFKYKLTASDALPNDDNRNEEDAQAHHYINTPQCMFGIVDIDNNHIIAAEYKNIWSTEGGYFKIERVVEDTYKEHDRFGIVNMKGDIVIQPSYEELTLLRIEEKDFWIITQNRKKGVINAGLNIIPIIFDDILFKDEIFYCKDNSYFNKNNTFVKYNINGEILIDYMGFHNVVSAEYDVAYYSDYGLIRVVKEGKWGFINMMNDVVVPPSFSFIDSFNGQFAKVANAEDEECIFFPDKYILNAKYGLIDTSGDIVLPIEHEHISKWDNGYYCVTKNNIFILLSPSLTPIFKTERRMEKFNDRYILVRGESKYSIKYGLIDFNGKEIIPPDETHSFSEIEVLDNGFLKVTYNKCGCGGSHIGIINNIGKTVFENRNCDDIKFLDDGFILVEQQYYESPTSYYLANFQGKYILVYPYDEIKMLNEGLISIKDIFGWGLADIRGNIIIDTYYLEELFFEDGISTIKVEGSLYTHKINLKGVVIVHDGNKETELPNNVFWGTDFTNQISIVRGKQRGDNIGVIDIMGNIILPTVYKSVCLLSNKTLLAQEGDLYGIFDLNGNAIFPTIFTSIEHICEDRIRVSWNQTIAPEWYKGDFTPISKVKYNKYNYEINNTENLRSAICNSKAEVLNDKDILYVWKFKCGYARACKGLFIESGDFRERIVRFKQIGVIDTSGKTIIPFIYDRIIIYEDSPYASLEKDGVTGIANLKSGVIKMYCDLNIKHLWDIDKFGRCIFSEDCKYDIENDDWIGGSIGVLSINGILVPTGKYDDIQLLNNGMIKVKKANLFGLLDKEGNEVLPTIYSYISTFVDNLATVCYGGKQYNDWLCPIEGGKWGVINTEGTFIKECIFDKEEVLEKHKDVKIVHDLLGNKAPSIIISDKRPKRKDYKSYDYGYYSYSDYDDEGSYSKYGGYNGWDDNTIDEVFDGNPELTWNID